MRRPPTCMAEALTLSTSSWRATSSSTRRDSGKPRLIVRTLAAVAVVVEVSDSRRLRRRQCLARRPTCSAASMAAAAHLHPLPRPRPVLARRVATPIRT